MSSHPALSEIERLLPLKGGEDARRFAHVLLCDRCAERALAILNVDRSARLEEESSSLDAFAPEDHTPAGEGPCSLRQRGENDPVLFVEDRDRTADFIQTVRSASYRRLKRTITRLGDREPWSVISSALLKLGHLAVPESPGQARNLAQLASFAAARASSLPEVVQRSLLVEGECLLGDSLRRLGRLRAAECAFARAVRHMTHECEPKERAYFLVALANLREREERYEEALALRDRAGKLYDALGAVDLKAGALSEKAALEIARAEIDAALETLSEIFLLIERGLDGRFAVGAAVSAAALLSSPPYLGRALAILKKVRVRYPDLAETEEMAALNLLEGRLCTFASRPALAKARLVAAFRAFSRLGLLHDAAVASLGLAVLFLQWEEEDLRATADETVETLLGADLPEGVRAGLTSFRDAVRAGRATLTLANALMSYIERSEANPNLKFVPPREQGRRR